MIEHMDTVSFVYNYSGGGERLTRNDLTSIPKPPDPSHPKMDGIWTVSYTHLDVYKRQSPLGTSPMLLT